MVKLYTYKSIIISVLLLVIVTQVQAQPLVAYTSNNLFKIILSSVLLTLIHLPFILLSFFYAVNGHKYNEKERSDRLFSLAILAVFNSFLLIYSIFQSFYLGPFLVLMAVPVTMILVGHYYGYRPFYTWLLSMLYSVNIILFVAGGLDNPIGFGSKNGTYYQYHKGNKQQISSLSHFKYGQKDGHWQSFYANGQLSTEFNYQDGVLEGYAKEYFKNGQLKQSYQFKDNAIEGQFLSFYRNKQAASKRKFKNGLLEGIEKVYYENGTLSRLYNYKKGEKYGRCKAFFPNGKLKSSRIYSKEPQECKAYYPNGQLKETGLSQGEKKEGLWNAYHDNGNLSATGYYLSSEYDNSVRHGLWKTYYPNGQLETSGEYEKGVRKGEWIKYFEDGEKSDERDYGG